MGILDTMLNEKINGDTVMTPEKVAQDMVGLLPSEVWTSESTFLDIACKGGIFLKLIYDKLMKTDELIEKFTGETDRRNHILQNQLYGLAVSEFCAAISQRRLYGKMNDNGNIRYVNGYNEIIRDTGNRFKLNIERTFKNMKFDVVIGNPPYNRGMDLDFVNKGFDLCTKYCVMITPAKWQTAADNYSGCASKTIDYKGFRKKLVPHMSKVVFYPMSSDVFDISSNSGITYFIMGQEKHELCEVINKWSCFTEYYNTTEVRGILNGETLCNIGKNIANHINTRGQFTYIRKKRSDKKYCVWGTSAIPAFQNFRPGSKVAHYMTSDLKICESKDINLSSDSFIFFESDNLDECKSFVSYMYTRLVRFLASIYISVFKGWNQKSTFKYVPAPPSGKFDHIYTDEELYKAFNLPQKYIDVVEAVIKERK